MLGTALLLCAAGPLPAAAAGAKGHGSGHQQVVRIALNPLDDSFLPIFLGIDKGYFKAEGIDIKVQKFSGSTVNEVPLLARGDLDVLPEAAGPSLFNAASEGFQEKIVSSISESHKGWHDTAWLLVRKDLAGSVHKLSDLRGLHVDGGGAGSPNDYLARNAIRKAGLSLDQVQYTNQIHSSDAVAALQNKAVDVLASAEPEATALVAQGLAVRWKSYQNVVPHFQETYLVASPKFAKTTACVHFLKAYVKAAQEVTKSAGKWTPLMVRTIAKWSGLSKSVIEQVPGPTYVGQLGRIRVSALSQQQKFWEKLGLVKTPTSIHQLVDTKPLAKASR